MKPTKLKKMHEIAKDFQGFFGENCDVRWRRGSHSYELWVKSHEGLTGYVDEVIATCFQREGNVIFSLERRGYPEYLLRGDVRKLVQTAVKEHAWMGTRLNVLQALLKSSLKY